jgi:hypothetical protein
MPDSVTVQVLRLSRLSYFDSNDMKKGYNTGSRSLQCIKHCHSANALWRSSVGNKGMKSVVPVMTEQFILLATFHMAFWNLIFGFRQTQLDSCGTEDIVNHVIRCCTQHNWVTVINLFHIWLFHCRMPGLCIFRLNTWYQGNKLSLVAIWSLQLQQGAKKTYYLLFISQSLLTRPCEKYLTFDDNFIF